MKNIFVEGLQGMGKSTLVRVFLQKLSDYKVYREGDICPLELAWCSWMTLEEYEGIKEKYPDIVSEIEKWSKVEGDHVVVAYTRILTDYPGFHKYMEQFEIYNGRKTYEELKEVVFQRYENFRENGNVFECAFLQNIVDEMILFLQLSDDDIVAFYKEFYEKVEKETFCLFYLDGDDIEGNIEIIREERCDQNGNEMWYPLMMAYLQDSPYGKSHECKELKDLVEYLRHRQAVERRIISEVIGENAVILPSKKWKMDELEKVLIDRGIIESETRAYR